MEIIITTEFENLYKKLPENIKKKAYKQTEMFKKDVFYPSLHTEKLEPKDRALWSFRVDDKYRILFRFNNKNSVRFLVIGSHDWIYKIKF
ncbi:MAG: hypothetical protein COV57_00795 [Candidatus Liptonbacteria bacterium CG11_big_fil_rev_8_21_14_0_20_35_14]|uniref:ParE-like toxin domain-containing protein n=1 Tax=Candidatus Liptonbacteria bacterium CG11_big_fil_rev_8_21_14_0_20_35_14 TaxID=1974634 RepID=A0A2H0N895_9BACT|nr:MAG: hypothetical protein COV57_00795 [Candidatus Liptonbacteria bacterium CG11_big_fil_rev_8_21_14_0_20_35_14]